MAQIENYHLEEVSAIKMIEAARIEFEAACYRNDTERLRAARAKLMTTVEAWCDLCSVRVARDRRRAENG